MATNRDKDLTSFVTPDGGLYMYRTCPLAEIYEGLSGTEWFTSGRHSNVTKFWWRRTATKISPLSSLRMEDCICTRRALWPARYRSGVVALYRARWYKMNICLVYAGYQRASHSYMKQSSMKRAVILFIHGSPMLPKLHIYTYIYKSSQALQLFPVGLRILPLGF
jgi:hypothetical protein